MWPNKYNRMQMADVAAVQDDKCMSLTVQCFQLCCMCENSMTKYLGKTFCRSNKAHLCTGTMFEELDPYSSSLVFVSALGIRCQIHLTDGNNVGGSRSPSEG
jgi:hypothetical protein